MIDRTEVAIDLKRSVADRAITLGELAGRVVELYSKDVLAYGEYPGARQALPVGSLQRKVNEEQPWRIRGRVERVHLGFTPQYVKDGPEPRPVVIISDVSSQPPVDPELERTGRQLILGIRDDKIEEAKIVTLDDPTIDHKSPFN